LAIGGQTGTIQLWDANTGALLNTLISETTNRVVSLAYSPDGQILAAGMKDTQMPAGALTSTVWLWDAKTGILLKSIEDYQANIVYLTFSPDGALLATVSLDGTMRLWGITPR
jgi:WD40 repeat protein